MKNVYLDIERVEQINNYDCSIGCLAMIMNFYGDSADVTELNKDLSDYVNEKERHIEASAIYLLKKGYEVFFQNHNLKVLENSLIDLTEKDYISFENEFKKLKEDSFRKKKLSLILEYIKNNGTLSTTKPTIDTIENHLKNNHPVVVGVNLSILRDNAGLRGNHYVVVNGMRDDRFIVTDPSLGFKEPYEVSKGIIEEAWSKMGYYTLVAYK